MGKTYKDGKNLDDRSIIDDLKKTSKLKRIEKKEKRSEIKDEF